MTLIRNCYRLVHSRFSRKPSRFGYIIEGKLAASGRLMTHSQLTWAIRQGIKTIITIREQPLEEKWFVSNRTTSNT
jgi:atypical dual specificity phosphatase